MNNNLGKYNFGCVVKFISNDQLSGMFCIGGDDARNFDTARFLKDSQALNRGMYISKSQLIEPLALRIVSHYFQREIPGADIEELAHRGNCDARAVSALRGTPFWMMTMNLSDGQIDFDTLTKNNFIDYCHMFDREMMKENPFGGERKLAA